MNDCLPHPLEILNKHKIPYTFYSYSALDEYFRCFQARQYYVRTEASLIELARFFEELEYPGLPFLDAMVSTPRGEVLFSCAEEDYRSPGTFPFTVQKLLYDPGRRCFYDPLGIYRDLRKELLKEVVEFYSPEISLLEGARLTARYGFEVPREVVKNRDIRFHFPEDIQRELLNAVLCSPYADKGLLLLHHAGFTERLWPEIYKMSRVEQTKDYHPEGDVWIHTLETLKYRKTLDLTLSLALLFHDIGKPVAVEQGTVEKPFDGHSEIGAEVAARFLGRLGYAPELIKDVCFLIRYHMMPFALGKLPLYRTEKVMNSPLFPMLLEVYRADLSSSFWGPEGYYEACRIYRQYLRNKKNPYRKADGSIA